MEELSERSGDIEMFFESSDDMEDIVNVLNEQIEQLEQKVEYYKTKANERFMFNMKLYIENEQLKKQVDNLKSFIAAKLPPYLNSIVEYL